ncbi:beta-ketoacyl synthase N-terminal-like domain-containing protein [Candidatus Mycolicibacterium alkanivorans]|uniref:Acyltransferase domain-containing protein n=1 Tax=Candidatus Mycolicibacterium alkanivorans TaxID=2954114 RepID=A0ABS9YSZ1_9MYCO|nr:beta-ketoacyl synthase N-terminal-like domain-containing protein [Candidatus Mycolicibacterium alkanivorans]MCI4674258.1 acyltransferase domain-containing protein [Candidatus Mycolicibacterium alkanivorans]
MSTHDGYDDGSNELPPNAIAVIGMAGKFPGADSVTEFWDNLSRGVESVTTLSEEVLTAAGVSAKTLDDPAYVRRAAMLNGIEEFDADYFGMTPYTARMMDPQQRLFLQTAWHALEDSGYDPATYDGAIGVFASSTASGYLMDNLMSHRDTKKLVGEGITVEMFNLVLLNDKDYLATRVSHELNLRGPSLTVQAACSSSLVAVHLACQSLLSGECDMALTGASAIRVPHGVGYTYEPGAMVSPSGHCRPFDVRSDGTIFGSGVAALILKPLQAALDDGDRIHAVIRGSAINNDGSMKMTYAAPAVAGQAEVIAEAHAVAEVDASTIGFVETHGTGTPLGDPIEIEALRQAFELSELERPGPCVLGSVKSNIGHLDAASGVSGLVKTILCLKNKAIPPTVHFTAPNPELHLENTPFVVSNTYLPWESEAPLRAGVSSFGVGGTNVHVVVEEAPDASNAPAAPSGPQVLLLSARTAESLQDAKAALAGELARDERLSLPDVAFTLATRRTHEVRLAAVVADRADACAVLTAAEHENVSVAQCPPGAAPGAQRTAFLFPGQGAQHVGMARGLYDTEPVFRETFDRCAAGFGEEFGIDLKAEVLEGTGGQERSDSGKGSGLEPTDLAQPALFAVEYALAQLVMSYGVTPTALAGHSIGELVAAAVAGVFDLDSAIKAVAMRARLMHSAPAGAMVAVASSPDDIAAHMAADVDLAAVNEFGSCVVAGPEQAIKEFANRLAAVGIVARRVRTSHAFHSQSMDSVLQPFAEFLSTLTLHAPRIPMLSNVTGTWMTNEEATDPKRWAQHIRSTVRFADEVQTLLGDTHRVLVEVGPGGSLTGSAVRMPDWADTHRAVRLMRHPVQTRDDRDAFLLALGRLWSAGVDVDWSRLYGEHPQRVTLPGYAFARQRYWIDPDTTAVRRPGGPASDAAAQTAAANSQAVAPTDARAQMRATLQRIWSQCLGVESVAVGDNFFELGGDSLVAIGVAMTASHEGVELTPQDLYDNNTLAALADTLVTRHSSGGLASQDTDELNPPVPPNILRFLDGGLADPGRWRAPLVLRLDSRVSAGAVRAVMTAVVNHHDALRMRVVNRAGVWEQHIDAPGDFTDLTERALPADAAAGSAQERESLQAIVSETIAAQELRSGPLTATFVVDAAGAPRFLVLTAHGTVDDLTSREVLMTDLLTAFGQQLAGNDIALEPATTSWRAWSQRCAALAAHPAVLARRSYWIDTEAAATVRLANAGVTGAPGAGDLTRLAFALTPEQTSQIDNARRVLQASTEEILLAALARSIAATVGEGVATVDLAGAGRAVLRPEVDFRRTIGWFSTIYPIALPCMGVPGASAAQLLAEVSQTVNAVPHHGIGYGLLRYLHAPTARLLGAAGTADVYLSYLGMIPEWRDSYGPVQFDSDSERTVRETLPGLGHPLELRSYRHGGVLHADWWYDRRRVPSGTAEALAEQFPAALMQLLGDALMGDDGSDDNEAEDEALALVDLSAAVFDDDE